MYVRRLVASDICVKVFFSLFFEMFIYITLFPKIITIVPNYFLMSRRLFKRSDFVSENIVYLLPSKVLLANFARPVKIKPIQGIFI